jgi:protein involved in polysaccharide export with SLBB domain
MVLACAAAGAEIGSAQADNALPAGFSEYVQKLSPDADKVISVVGGVRNPHTIPATEGLTVSKAIEIAGGFGDFANRRKVGLWRPKEGQFSTVDVRAVLQKKPGASDPVLGAGDVVIVIPICNLRF